MKTLIFSLSLFMSLSLAHNDAPQMMVANEQPTTKSFSEGEEGYLDPNIVDAPYLSVKGMEIKGFDSISLDKMHTAMSQLEQVVNSQEFKDRVINFKNRDGVRAFKSNKDLTNEEIYTIFMEGRETLQPNTPNEMNFYLKLYNKPWSRVVGYTSATTNVININWKFFRNFESSSVAANLAHEWTHKIGFDHKSAAESDSAPYAIGRIVGELAEKLAKKNHLH